MKTTPLLLIAVSMIQALSIVQGPQVGNNRPASFTVGWQTDSSSSSRLEWGLSPTDLTGVTQDLANRTWHVLKAEPLLPGRVYHYRVLSGGTRSPVFTTKTAGDRDTPFRFGVITDTHGGSIFSSYSAAYSRILLADSADLWFNTGDVVGTNGDSTPEWRFGRQLLYKKQSDSVERHVPIYELFGNHDGGMDRFWANTDTTDYGFILPEDNIYTDSIYGKGHFYSFDQGIVHFLIIDGRPNDVKNRTILQWMEADIKAAKERGQLHTIVLTHYGIMELLSPPSWGGNAPSWTRGNWYYTNGNRAAYYHLLDTLGVEIQMHGHWHNYCRTKFGPGLFAGFDTLWQQEGFKNHIRDLSCGRYGGSIYGADTTLWRVEYYNRNFTQFLVTCDVHFRQILFRGKNAVASGQATVVDSFKLRPDAPQNLRAERAGPVVSLSWDKVENGVSLNGVGGYRIYRSAVSYDSIRNTTRSRYMLIGTLGHPDSTAFTDTHPELDQSDKYYVVSAFDTNFGRREGNYSNEARASLVNRTEIGLPPTAGPRIFPNPASGGCWIETLPDFDGRIDVIGADGRITVTFAAPFNRRIRWDGRTADGVKVPAGIYTIRWRKPHSVRAKKIILLH